MTSPSAPGVIHPAHAGGVRVAFYGRVARDDDPQAAIDRQLRAVLAALPAQTPIVGYFADVGPWNGLRGCTHPTGAWSLAGHPVDGGLLDLLDRARRPDRRFDVVACSDADRLSRRLLDRVRLEGDLATSGVRVLTCDDPMIATPHPLDPRDPTHQNRATRPWTAAGVRAILANPVYTGHHVSNRVDADRRLRLRPIGEWTWSPTPAHDPVIALNIYLAAPGITTIRQSPSDGPGHTPGGDPMTQQRAHRPAGNPPAEEQCLPGRASGVLDHHISHDRNGMARSGGRQ